MKLKKFKGGVHPPSSKHLTSSMPIVDAAVPSSVLIPLSQHIGAPCKPVVEVGDQVKMGQKVGESAGFVSSPVHASVSGVVKGFEQVPAYGNCIVIENDGRDEPDPSLGQVTDPESLDADQLKKLVLEAGIVGLGGATFPSHVKFSPPKEKPIEFLVLNGSECEPFLTSDHRVMVEQADLVVRGMKYIMKMVGSPTGIIGIEDNKQDAIGALREAAKGEADIEVVTLREKYPQGSEKHLIYTCTGREVPSGGLPMDVGVVVNNVGTAVAVAEAVDSGKPLIDRVVTVTGTGVQTPRNYRVRIGTLISELVEQSGGYKGEIGKVIVGGPMMGKTLYTDLVPVTKGTSGVLVLKKEDVAVEKPMSCVRCAKCVDACPMLLEPTTLAKNSEMGRWEQAEENHVADCIECGCCTYVCPAKIPIVQHIKHAKQMIKEKKAREKAEAEKAKEA